jgi:hypothetical protein
LGLLVLISVFIANNGVISRGLFCGGDRVYNERMRLKIPPLWINLALLLLILMLLTVLAGTGDFVPVLYSDGQLHRMLEAYP